MPREELEETAQELLGTTYEAEEVPNYPGRIFWREAEYGESHFFTSWPYDPIEYIEVRFREAHHTEDGDYTIYETRAIDNSTPTDAYSEWFKE
jgi:hypothetical protein